MSGSLLNKEALAQRLAELSPEKRRAFEKLLREQGIEAAALPIVPRRVGELTSSRRTANGLPLSSAQQRLWLLDQLEPGLPYHISVAVRFEGRLDLAALEQSLNAIIRRHEVLRTTFGTQDGQPVQIVAPEMSVTIKVVDLQKLPASERAAEVQRLAAQEARRAFNLQQGPLFRVTLLKLGETEHVFIPTVHHIVFDGWSFDIFVRELKTLYETFTAGKPSPLPELALQYGDYAQWQQEWLTSEALEVQLAYWQKQLLGAPPVLELPTDRPRPAAQNYRGAHYKFQLSPNLSRALHELSRKENATLFMTLLAAFKTLLYRYSGQTDIVVGTPTANRMRVELEGLIGYFANTLVLRTDLAGVSTFRELLRRVREMAVAAYAHQDLPFEKLVESIQPGRDLSYNPIFQVLFALHNAPFSPLQLPGLTMSPLPVDNATARFDLALDMYEEGACLIGVLEYSTDLFETATIERMSGHLQTMLEAIVVNPDQRLATMPLLTAGERQKMLVDWNGVRTDFAPSLCMHELFEAHAARRPDAIAVVCENERLSYCELNRRADQLAQHLQKLGVGPEMVVGIFVERSVAMMVGLLGILKAGGAYLPLDPKYPKDRLAFMLQDARAPVLLTQHRLIASLPEHQARVVCLDADWPAIAREREEKPASQVTAGNVAYVIYTSGSTGKPKGIQVNHYSVIHLLEAIQRQIDFGEEDIWTVFHSYAFDLSVWEIFGCLLYGGRLVIVPAPLTPSPVAFYDLLCDEGVTIVNQTPSAARQLVEAKNAAGPRDWRVRLMICGGEAFPRELAPLLLKWKIPVWNFYGPTEATVWTSIDQVKASDARPGAVPIGYAFADMQFFVLDASLQLVPAGVPSELHIGGIGLARGYFNRPELTAEKFIPHAFSNAPGARLYKTGDLVRRLADGNIEFLARLDYQVKVRGFRIELGEIEAALSQHPAVRENVVIARDDGNGDKMLAGYVAPTRPSMLTVGELQSFLRKKLPEYMVPSVFMFLETLPLTPNGKVDRRALMMLETGRPEAEENFVAPRTPVEVELAEIWMELLRLKQVGVHDNFFSLGGHSLIATRLILKVRAHFGVEISLHDFFMCPSIAPLAEKIEAALLAQSSNAQLAALLEQLDDVAEAEAESLLAART